MIYLNLPHVTLTLLYQKRTMSQPKINTGDLCTCCKQNVAYFQHQQDYGGNTLNHILNVIINFN